MGILIKPVNMSGGKRDRNVVKLRPLREIRDSQLLYIAVKFK